MNSGHAGNGEFEVFEGVRLDLLGMSKIYGASFGSGAVVGSASLREGAAAAGVGVASAAKDVVPMQISIGICITNRGVRILDP